MSFGSDFLTEILVQKDNEVLKSKTNHYKPIVLTSNEDMIRIKYLSVGPNAEHEQVLKLITDHCNGSYIETSREAVEGWTTVEAECAQNTDSLKSRLPGDTTGTNRHDND